MNIHLLREFVLIILSAFHAVAILNDNEESSCEKDRRGILEVIELLKWRDFLLLAETHAIANCMLKAFPLMLSTWMYSSRTNITASLGAHVGKNENDKLLVWVTTDHLELVLKAAHSWKFFRKGYTWVFIVERVSELDLVFGRYLREDSTVFIFSLNQSTSGFEFYCVNFDQHSKLVAKRRLVPKSNDHSFMVRNSSSDRTTDIRRHVLKIGYFPYCPLVCLKLNIHENTTMVKGYFPELMEIFSLSLGFDYQFVREPTNIFGNVDENGTWNGLMGLLQKEEVDLIVNVAIAELRMSATDFLPTVIKITNKVVIRDLAEINAIDFYQYLRPFSFGVWVLVLTACISATLCMTLIWSVQPLLHSNSTTAFVWENCECGSKSQLKYRSYLGQSMYFFLLLWKILLKQDLPNNLMQKNLPLNLVVVSFALFVVIVMSSYLGVSTAFMSVKKSVEPYDSLSELLRAQKYDVGILGGTLVHQEIKHAKMGVLNELRESLARKPSNILNSTAVGVQRVCHENFAFIGAILGIVAQNPTCNLQAIRGSVQTVFLSIGFQKDSPYVEAFRRQFLLIRSSGVLNKQNQLFLKSSEDLHKHNNGGQPVSGLHQVVVVLSVLGFGVLLSLICACIEKLLE